MMWVCRAGQKSIYAEYYFATRKIYIPWDGFQRYVLIPFNHSRNYALAKIAGDYLGTVSK